MKRLNPFEKYAINKLYQEYNDNLTIIDNQKMKLTKGEQWIINWGYYFVGFSMGLSAIVLILTFN